MKTLSELFAHELRDVYSSEHLLVDALDSLAQQTTERNISNAFMTHRAETQEHIRRLETVAKETGLMLRRAGCAGMEGLLKEHQEFAQEHPEKALFDLCSVWAAQKVERYEMTAYETLIALAEELGLAHAAEQLTATLDEEEAAFNTLKELAEEFDTSELLGEEEEEEEPARHS